MKRLAINNLPFYVTIVINQRRPIFKSDKSCSLLIEILETKRKDCGFCLYEFVIMPDHYHLIIKPAQDYTISDTMRHINGAFSREWNVVNQRTGQLFQHGFHDHIIRNPQDYLEKANYIHQNPVTAGLVDKPEHYPWSSARNRILGNNSLIELDDIE